MRLSQRPLLPIVLLLLLIACGIAITARTRAMRNIAAPVVGCIDDCKERLDKTLDRCSQLPDASRERCREVANNQYNKCAERCGD
ncbi:MAG TPA: hypothetical protein VF735_02170 [Pyrinomonadaceae bacterium]